MPELPEAETVARTLFPHINNCKFVSTDLLRSSALHPLSLPLSELEGLFVSGTHRRGKMIIVDLARKNGTQLEDVEKKLIFHLRMTGRLHTKDAPYDPDKHTRCLFNMLKPDGSLFCLLFDDVRTFGKIMLATPEILSQWDFWKNLGPEPLEITPEEFAPLLKNNCPIKTAIMDQSVIAGVGNIYADESLFAAGINPARKASSLSLEESSRLLLELQKILRKSISQCGSSIRDYRDANGNVGAFQNSFSVYGKAGEPCKHCAQPLQRMRINGRATTFCPNCQK